MVAITKSGLENPRKCIFYCLIQFVKHKNVFLKSCQYFLLYGGSTKYEFTRLNTIIHILFFFLLFSHCSLFFEVVNRGVTVNLTPFLLPCPKFFELMIFLNSEIKEKWSYNFFYDWLKNTHLCIFHNITIPMMYVLIW